MRVDLGLGRRFRSELQFDAPARSSHMCRTGGITNLRDRAPQVRWRGGSQGMSRDAEYTPAAEHERGEPQQYGQCLHATGERLFNDDRSGGHISEALPQPRASRDQAADEIETEAIDGPECITDGVSGQ